MRPIKIDENRHCPKCGKTENQINKGFNPSGSQRCRCKDCGIVYTINPKKTDYPEETNKLALRMYYSGVSGRGVGKVLGMSKANIYNWIKKTKRHVNNSYDILELDELYWSVLHRPRTKTQENIYLITMVSRNPRQIVGFDVAYDKAFERIQDIVDSSPTTSEYHTDGYWGYVDTLFPGKHIRNIHDKSNTFTAESINADLRHYIHVLARKSRCFARKLETLKAVVTVFADAYNQFGLAKQKFRQHRKKGELPFSVVDFL